jgi:plasmid stability protein
MALSLSVKNVPEPLAEALRARAESKKRYFQGVIMSILEQAVARISTEVDTRAATRATAAVRPAVTLSIDDIATRAAKLFPGGTPSSVEFIRAMRDGRYGDGWARTGHHDESA